MSKVVNRTCVVYMQGGDAKARNWTSYFSAPVCNFITLQDMLNMLWTTRSDDVLIYRYQNCPPRLSAAFAILSVIVLQLIKAKLLGTYIVWICHNVDQDTSPYHKRVERVRRWLLSTLADTVFVLDPAFITYCTRNDAKAISFGPKFGGCVSDSSMAMIRDLKRKVDRVVLVAGQDGGKYKGFARIPQVQARFGELGLSVGFVTAGMCLSRVFPHELEVNLIRVIEPNIRESNLIGLVDYIYRENADISVPYTIYAAATAGIPILTNKNNILADIVIREDVGLTLDMLDSNISRDFDFEGFLARHQWSSLRDALRNAGVKV